MRSSRFQLQSLSRRWSARKPSVTSLVVISCVAIFSAHWIVFAVTGETLFSQDTILRLFGLQAATVRVGSYWQFASFALVHAGPIHLLANVLLLYFAGREVEPIIGSRHFLGMFLLANAVGGVAQWAAMAAGLAPGATEVVGVSAGVAAVVTAFATILPELEVTVFLLFVLPLRVRAKMFAPIVIGTAAALWMGATATVVGPAGILVGSIVGWAYVKTLGFGNPLAIERYFRERRQQASRLERMPVGQFLTEEIDPLLEKVARGGMGSLTRAEKKLLQQGSVKLAGAKREALK